MKFALVNGERQEPEPNLSGSCPSCGSPMISRCGEVRVRHWAHKGRRDCDPWWEPESEWHRNWKNQFPIGWQEVVRHAPDGERHIADVRTEAGCVIEFQHSYIKPEERRAREAFYRPLVWVVDGLRRPRDRARFLKTWEEGAPVRRDSPFQRIWSGEGALLRDWRASTAGVFFDFGEEILWWLLPKSEGDWVYVARVSRAEFIEAHRRLATPARDVDSSVMESIESADEARQHRHLAPVPLEHDHLRRFRPRHRFRF